MKGLLFFLLLILPALSVDRVTEHDEDALEASIGCPNVNQGCPNCVASLGCYWIPASGIHKAKCRNAVRSLRYISSRVSVCPLGGGGPVVLAPVITQEQRWLNAFAKARYWHGTSAEYVKVIRENGLQLENQGYWFGRSAGEKGPRFMPAAWVRRHADESKAYGPIYMGRCSASSVWALKKMGDWVKPAVDDKQWNQVMRVFLPAEYGENTYEYWVDERPQDESPEAYIKYMLGPHKIITDVAMSGGLGSAFTFNADIPNEYLHFGSMLEAVEDRPQILHAIASHDTDLSDLSYEAQLDLHNRVFAKHPANEKNRDYLWYAAKTESDAEDYA